MGFVLKILEIDLPTVILSYQSLHLSTTTSSANAELVAKEEASYWLKVPAVYEEMSSRMCQKDHKDINKGRMCFWTMTNAPIGK